MIDSISMVRQVLCQVLSFQVGVPVYKAFQSSIITLSMREGGREGEMGSVIPIHFSWQWNPHSNIAADGDFCPPCNKNIYSFYFTSPCENECHSQVLHLKKLLSLTLFCNINEPRVFEIKFQMTFRVFWIDPYKVDSICIGINCNNSKAF